MPKSNICAGIQLLQKMGWRQGKGIGKQSSHKKTRPDSKWGPMKGVSVENVEVHRLALKDDTHGLGFDPFKVLLPSSILKKSWYIS